MVCLVGVRAQGQLIACPQDKISACVSAADTVDDHRIGAFPFGEAGFHSGANLFGCIRQGRPGFCAKRSQGLGNGSPIFLGSPGSAASLEHTGSGNVQADDSRQIEENQEIGAVGGQPVVDQIEGQDREGP